MRISDPKPHSDHQENVADLSIATETETNHVKSEWNEKQQQDGDTAMALFSDPNALHEAIDPVEARKLLWKIDLMILPYLAVCYAFFYIDKVVIPQTSIILLCNG